MEKLYIKFIEGDKESLNNACKIAESLGYIEAKTFCALNFEGYGLLNLRVDGTYGTSIDSEEKLKEYGYREHIQEKEKNIYVIFGGNKTPNKEHFSLSLAEEEAKRLCKKENKPFYVCEILAKYENVAILSDNINL